MTVASPEIAGFTLGFNLIAAKQRRFTITATGNPNGASDVDVAYIPDPSSPGTDPVLAEQMNRLLSSVAPEVRSVLETYAGQIAPINAGVQPWLFQTSASISKRINISGVNVTVRADIFNILNLINNRAGYYNVINNEPLFKYDSDTESYSVNEGFGTYRRGGQPYNIQLGLKVEF